MISQAGSEVLAAAAATTTVGNGLFGTAGVAPGRRVRCDCVGTCGAIRRYDVDLIAGGIGLDLRD